MKQQVHRFINSRFGAALCSSLIPQPINSGGFRIQTGDDRVVPLEKVHLRLGRYERYERMLVREHFRDDLNTIDLGASLGVISCEILRRLKTGKLISVEADPELCEIARRNIETNHPGRDAEVVNAAVAANWGGASPFNSHALSPARKVASFSVHSRGLPM